MLQRMYWMYLDLAGCIVGCIRCIELSQDVLSDVMQMY